MKGSYIAYVHLAPLQSIDQTQLSSEFLYFMIFQPLSSFESQELVFFHLKYRGYFMSTSDAFRYDGSPFSPVFPIYLLF